MKSKFIKILIAISVVISSCNNEIQPVNNDLLTLSSWTAEPSILLNGEKSKLMENHIFHKNGTYTQQFTNPTGQVVMKTEGKWNWTEDNEIYYQINSVNVKETEHKLEKPLGYYLQILEVSEITLKTLRRSEGDAWDSGFAKEKIYTHS
ncbi:hypothetical protein SanaruYs_14690 [Chryseotalea sanaruensis]|uniref:Lipocalin-like domain-containing protein n=1 Tax=Chryseotalea sanaruensis TaxID=2482724 RepID=A0A401U8M3_9BACT|nr:hypothetical protein [Chryseotalea sanaruensis]GCC51248.1 hypothetical protein SanaruYs_14690 [Chryseotalea sanaruensis]